MPLIQSSLQRFWLKTLLFALCGYAVLCFWLSFLIIMSFSVVLEGPYGGIWFWSIIGFGVAAMRVQKYEARHVVSESPMMSSEDPNSVASLVYAQPIETGESLEL